MKEVFFRLEKASAEDLSELYLHAKQKSKECEEIRKERKKKNAEHEETSSADFLSRVSEVLAQMQQDISAFRAMKSDSTSLPTSDAFKGWVRGRKNNKVALLFLIFTVLFLRIRWNCVLHLVEAIFL